MSVPEAQESAQRAFDMLWQPGMAQRTQSRDKAQYWLSLRIGIKPDVLTFEGLGEAKCREIAKVCTAAHGPAAFCLGDGR